MRKTLRSLLGVATVGLGLAGLMPTKKAEAQTSGSVEYIQSEKDEKSFARANTFYSLPGKANGYSFIEFYRNGGGYFGKTMASRPIVSGLGPKVEAVHNGELVSRVGFGASFSVPGMPKGSYLNLGLLPVWISAEQKRMQAQYVLGVSLPEGFNLSSFGEMNLRAQGGPQWGYGEAELTKSVGPFDFGYHMRLYDDGDATPKPQHGLVVRLNFGGKK